MKILIILFMLASSSLSLAHELIDGVNWHFKKEVNHIKVFDASVENSDYKAVLAETLVEADIATLINLLRTPQMCSKWVYRCQSSVLYSQDSNTDVVYTTSKMPLIIEDRDVFAKITWNKDPVTHIVLGVGHAINGLPEEQNYIRIKNATMIWELTPLYNGNTIVKSYVHVNPGGDTPAWITNMLSINIPIKTLSELKKLLAAHAYK